MKTSKRIFSAGIILSLIFAMTLMFAGCGGPSTLEEYINSDSEAKEMIDSMSSGSGMTIDVKDNTLTYTYTYSQTFDDAVIGEMKTQIESAMSSMSSSFESVASTLEEESGIDDITVKVIYEDGAGTEIFSEEY